MTQTIAAGSRAVVKQGAALYERSASGLDKSRFVPTSPVTVMAVKDGKAIVSTGAGRMLVDIADLSVVS